MNLKNILNDLWRHARKRDNKGWLKEAMRQLVQDYDQYLSGQWPVPHEEFQEVMGAHLVVAIFAAHEIGLLKVAETLMAIRADILNSRPEK